MECRRLFPSVCDIVNSRGGQAPYIQAISQTSVADGLSPGMCLAVGPAEMGRTGDARERAKKGSKGGFEENEQK